MLNVETHVFHSPQSYSSTETLWQKFCMVLFILQDLFFLIVDYFGPFVSFVHYNRGVHLV